jgi:outer membrane lipoprotein-sorting protein
VRAVSISSLVGALLVLAVGSALAGELPAGAKPVPKPPGLEKAITVDELVHGMQETYKGVHALRAEFLQTNKNAVTGVEEKQRGRLAVERPRKARFELGVPLQSAVVSDGQTTWIYSPAQKQVIVQKDLGGQANQVGVLIDDLSRLGELFEVSLQPPTQPPKLTHTVNLKPKGQQGGLGSMFKSVQLTVTKQRYELRDVVFVDQLDAVTRLTFSMVRAAPDIPDQEFVFKAPPGVAVVQM